MVEIIVVNESLLPEVKKIAEETWPKTFGQILTPEQISYMLEMMYNLEVLKSQVNERGHHYVLASEAGKHLGFCSFEHHIDQSAKTKIHRIYIMPDTQGKGIGKLLLAYVADRSKSKGDNALYLNVNRFNEKAIQFYERVGFRKIKEEVIDIGNGFVMDDFVMEIGL